jgi:hypothetical protein
VRHSHLSFSVVAEPLAPDLVHGSAYLHLVGSNLLFWRASEFEFQYEVSASPFIFGATLFLRALRTRDLVFGSASQHLVNADEQRVTFLIEIAGGIVLAIS